MRISQRIVVVSTFGLVCDWNLDDSPQHKQNNRIQRLTAQIASQSWHGHPAYGIDLIKVEWRKGCRVKPVKSFAKPSGGKWSWGERISVSVLDTGSTRLFHSIAHSNYPRPPGCITAGEGKSLEKRRAWSDPRTTQSRCSLRFAPASLPTRTLIVIQTTFFRWITTHDCQLFMNGKNVTILYLELAYTTFTTFCGDGTRLDSLYHNLQTTFARPSKDNILQK